MTPDGKEITICTQESPNPDADLHAGWKFLTTNMAHPTQGGMLVHTYRCRSCGKLLEIVSPYCYLGGREEDGA